MPQNFVVEGREVKVSKKSAILLGEQSLLIQCGEILQSHEWEIKAIVSVDPGTQDWCAEHGVSLFSDFNALKDQFQPQCCDYLFSITNLKMLPDWVLALGKSAINFHDGPLPKYAGLNAPVWAILNNEAEHGITWHEMTRDVDAGNILLQQRFPIVPGDTALSLNAKCYQAALETFEQLVNGIEQETLQPQVQTTGERSYFGLTKRPEAAGLIDWQSPVEQVERLVRALDHGTYRNPLVSAKLFLGDTLFVVKAARIVSRDVQTQPGSIIACSADALQVACTDGVVELSQFQTLTGQTVKQLDSMLAQAGLRVADTLPIIAKDVREQVSVRTKEVCKYEDRWVSKLLAAEAVSLPYGSSAQNAAWATHAFSMPASVCERDAYQSAPAAYALSLVAVLLSRLNNKTRFTLAASSLEISPIQAFFLSHLPLPIELDESKSVVQQLPQLKAALEEHQSHGALASDVWAREPALKGHDPLHAWPIKLVFGECAPALVEANSVGTELLIQLDPETGALTLHYPDSADNAKGVERFAMQLAAVATESALHSDRAVSELSVLSAFDVDTLRQWNATESAFGDPQCLHQLIEEQVALHPEETAIVFEGDEVSYRELNTRANQIARQLREQGVQAGELIGIMMDRSIDLLVTLVAIHKAGGAYVPLDPVYPAERLRYMIEDSGLRFLVTERRHQATLGTVNATALFHEELCQAASQFDGDNLDVAVAANELAYLIYTSGSTGKPKGVMVEHASVHNFFVGMDACIGKDRGNWLAVTSISFDISVLELFWTLSRGFKVVLYSDQNKASGDAGALAQQTPINMDFSLFYWNVADEESHHQADKYRLLLDGARFADANGFKAVWNPERHFAAFGGLFPNPSVTCAALATITQHVDLRAGSCVVPLHSPIRVAEEWAVVDNLSNGRVGMAVASGWAPPDFAIKPENFENSKSIMFESLEQVRRLWRGETLTFPGPQGDVKVRTLPRPIQKELPFWVTTAGNIETFKNAGRAGANVLTHLLGQTFEEVQEKVDAYRQARREAGHEGEGTVTLMLHTLIGDSMEQVEEIVRQPMKDYLKSAMFLVKGAAWNFPTFKKMSEETGKSLDEFFETMSDEDMDDLLEFAFQRYFRTSGLFGTPETARETVAKCKQIGVDEIACLIDFGIDTQIVLDHLPHLNRLKQSCVPQTTTITARDTEDYSIPALIERHEITHFQCTPSMATMLASDTQQNHCLKRLKHMMVGGEALSPALAEQLTGLLGGRLTNMYGPTETTIWSSTAEVQAGQEITIGHPIANTQIYIVDHNLKPMPIGVAGELIIGGKGVVRGYFERPELTAERFVDGFKLTPDSPEERVYRTGDLAKYDEDGRLIYLGRIDHQVKIRGYRIELGEIEALLQKHASVRECAVILREDQESNKRLVAYVRPVHGHKVDGEELKNHLAEQLPEFMVPAYYVELAAMPLTPNGKLDRNALPEPIQQRHENSDDFALPENEWENLIADIWKRALAVPEVGRKDNFFDIGGHSLLVIQVLKELREHEKVTKQIQMTDLFRYTTIESLAKFVASEGTEASTTAEVTSSRVAARKAAMGRRRRR